MTWELKALTAITTFGTVVNCVGRPYFLEVLDMNTTRFSGISLLRYLASQVSRFSGGVAIAFGF
jgi:hypothetical protein